MCVSHWIWRWCPRNASAASVDLAYRGKSSTGTTGDRICPLASPAPSPVAARLGQPHGETGVEERDGQVAAVAALVTGAWVGREPNQAALRAVFLERRDVAQPRPLHFLRLGALVRLVRVQLGFLLHARIRH